MTWKANEPMADFIGYLTNCFIVGDDITTFPDGSWSRNRLSISFADYEITLVQDPLIIRNSLSDIKGKTLVTTEVHVSELEPESFEDLLEKLKGLAKLLSLVTVSEVSICGWEYPNATPTSKHWAIVSQADYFRPLIESMDENAVKEFIEQAWPKYFLNEHTRKLPVAIGYFVTAEVREMPMELKLATMFILFENLKSTHAREKGYRFENNFYQRPEGGRWSFKGLLSDMFKSVDMSPELAQIVDLRNEIIHSGISQLTLEQQQNIYISLFDLSVEYFMRLLGFTGQYFLYSDN